MIQHTKELIGIRGYTKFTDLTTGEVLFEKNNEIYVDLFEYLSDSLFSTVDDSIQTLFDTGEVAAGGAQDGNDGISGYDVDNDDWLSFVTTKITETQLYAARWRGEMTNTVSRQVSQLALGHDFMDTAPYPFDTTFAIQIFNPVTLQVSHDYRVEWEIYLIPVTSSEEPET